MSIKTLLENIRGLVVLGRSKYLGTPKPIHEGRFHLPCLKSTVEVVWDQWSVPHIYADNTDDLFFAQGYIHAQERLWQMDFYRRLGVGRLAEILGPDAVSLDRWMRTLRIRYYAEKQAQGINGQTGPFYSAYANGINAFINHGRMPVEIDLLGYQPEPWEIADSISWAKVMAWDLSLNWETELLRAKLIDKLGPERAAELEPPYAEIQPLVIPKGVNYSCLGDDALRWSTANCHFTGPRPRDGLGSNNWVLSGERTNTNMPLLANDMHLGMSIPSIWFVNHLAAGDINVTGVSFPGVPFVLVGHNQHVAWGFTNGFTDVQDLFIERLKRTEDNLVLYEFKGEWLEANVYQEIIRVKGGTTIKEEVITTHHGPIINTLAPDFSGDSPIALKWTALESDQIDLGIYQMNLAKDCQSFREALRHWSVPSQNIVYADTNGDIGYSLPGKLPIRARGDGRVPVPGWTGEYEWTGYVPFEELPHMFNPPAGYIATANNKVVDDHYPHWIGFDYVSGNRAQRIVEMIEEQPVMHIEDFKAMQIDQVSPAARRVRDAIQNLEGDTKEIIEVLERFSQWDGTLSKDSQEAGIYQVFIRRLTTHLLQPILGDLITHYIGKGPTPVLEEGSMFGERSREWLLATLETPDSHWFDLGDGLSQKDHLLKILKDSVEELKRICGPRFSDWNWGKLHTLTFNHSLGSVKPLDRFFNRGPYPIGGDGDTVWSSHATLYDLSSETITGPPFRFIADLSDWDQSLGILVPGQSGHPASPSYDDNIQPWFNGEYHPMPFSPEAVKRTAHSTLTLEPGDKTMSESAE